MLGDSTTTMVESSADAAAAAPAGILLEGSTEIGMVGSNSAGEEDKAGGIRVIDESERSFGGNRWPRQETLALLKIRSEMDVVFRDSSLKGPLWEEVSRKLAELGYHRSAKKCKEKFENVYKYHKRTKDGRTGKSDGKTYRFFDQLEALQNLHSLNSLSPPKPQTPTPISSAMPWSSTTSPASNVVIHVPILMNPTNTNTNAAAAVPSINPTNIISTQAVPIHSINPYNSNNNNIQSSILNISSNLFLTSSTSSSTASDEDLDHDHQGSSNNKKKRKWKEFFRRLTKEVMEKQEELQNKFLQTVERCENERIAREEAWRVQEMARINREHEILVQERSTSAAKDAAVIAFLQKISGQQQPNSTVQQVQGIQPHPQPAAAPPLLQTQTQPQPPTQALMTNGGNNNNNNNNVVLSSPSRWPKAEVEALIKLRTNLDIKYQDNGPKAPLWEEISGMMRKLGYNRNAKRCKEKWENINKYFKKVKESNKARPEDSKTCPYFHQLDAIYKDKKISKNNENNMVPLMVQPEQQWPPPQQMEAAAAKMMENVDDQIQEDEEGEEEEDDDDGDTEEEYEVNDFEFVAKKTSTTPISTTAE